MSLNCPRCSTQLITSDFEKYDQDITLSTMAVDKCQSCDGIWFDKDELAHIQDTIDITLIEIRKLPDSEAQNRPLNCPKCQTVTMEKIQNARDKNVIMDVCPDCKGVWLDGGELKAIQQESLFKTLVWILKS